MKYLFVAPQVCSPWSEGRKLLVADLVDEMSSRDEVFVLTSYSREEETHFSTPYEAVACSSRPGHLIAMLQHLPGRISAFSPDIVCSFPYGTFRGLYGYVNSAYMTWVDTLCSRANVPCLTVMYSIDEYTTPERLQKRVSHLAVAHDPDWRGYTLDAGIKTEEWPAPSRNSADTSTLLFMTGLAQPTRERLNYMLEVRGLRVLLQAGRKLADGGLKLIIAAPMLDDADIRARLMAHPSNAWPADRIETRGAVAKPDIFRIADFLVFPYLTPITRFVPTSAIESMLAGTPVVMSDIPAFRALSDHGRAGFLFRNGDADDLARVVLAACADRGVRTAMSERARGHVKKSFSIRNTAAQLRDIAGEILICPA